MGRPKGSKNKPKGSMSTHPMKEEDKGPKKRGRPKGAKNKAKALAQELVQDASSRSTGDVTGHTIPPTKKGAKGTQKVFLCPNCDEHFTYEFKPSCKCGNYKIPLSESVKVKCPECKQSETFRYKTVFILRD